MSASLVRSLVMRIRDACMQAYAGPDACDFAEEELIG
jgi:hypothetical protein